MLFFLLSLFLSFLSTINAQSDQGVSTWSEGDPLVTIINTSHKDHAYDVERDSGAPPTAFATCNGCVKVAAGQTVRFHPGARFNGAITANHHTGTRHEVNFLSIPGQTWYNTDMELGMSDETLGPTDHRKKVDGGSSLAGESDCVAKANAAWHGTPREQQAALLQTGYIKGTVGGPLTGVTIDRNAPDLVVDWLQLTADFNSYVASGSVINQPKSASDAAADKKAWLVATNKMTITIY